MLFDIPYDVWTDIVQHVDRPTLRVLQATSSTLYSLACPILYQQVVYRYGITALRNESFWCRVLSPPSSNHRLYLPTSVLLKPRSVLIGPHRPDAIYSPANVFSWSTLIPIVRTWKNVVSLNLQNIVIPHDIVIDFLHLPDLEYLALTNVSIPVDGNSQNAPESIVASPQASLKSFVLKGQVRGDVDGLDRVWTVVETVLRSRSLRSVTVDVEGLPSMARMVSSNSGDLLASREYSFNTLTVIDNGRGRSRIWGPALRRVFVSVGTPLEKLSVLSLEDLDMTPVPLSFGCLRVLHGPTTLLLSLSSTTVHRLAEVVMTETIAEPLQFLTSFLRRSGDSLRELKILKLNVVAMDDGFLIGLSSVAPGLEELHLESEYEDLSTVRKSLNITSRKMTVFYRASLIHGLRHL
ncbi:hypothetical protein V5O48_003793 [Marasmius crinis-equi]|uniref:F-box domain-containing protein n=1 Tax=Marasmius crinis-equi TaxID=585013 RepID=A0ABR3FRX0_9AGAR